MAADCLMCRLAGVRDGDTFVARLSASTVLLDVDQRYRGKTVIVTREHVTDLLEMPEARALELYADVRNVARATRLALAPARLNYALLGNQEPHVHWHVIPRFPGDDGWGGAPRFEPPPTRLDPAAYRELARRLSAAIGESA